MSGKMGQLLVKIVNELHFWMTIEYHQKRVSNMLTIGLIEPEQEVTRKRECSPQDLSQDSGGPRSKADK